MRLAATVMLLRPGLRSGFEVLMLERNAASAFAPNAYVFPGGAVDEWDAPEHMHGYLLGDDEASLGRTFRNVASPLLPTTCDRPSHDEGRALLAAAARELFEEAGVLIVRTVDGALQHISASDPAIARLRDELRTHRRTFASVLQELRVMSDSRELALFSHWVTPVGEARRFNAFFFLTCTHREHVASSDGTETTHARWFTPREALEEHSQHRLTLIFPTIKHLERLASFDDLDALMVYATTKPVITIAPDRTPAQEFSIPASLEGAW